MGRLKLTPAKKSILIASPEEPVLNLERAHFEVTIHQIRVTGTWLRRGPDNWTQCLALTDGRKDPRKCVPCVIPLETSWIWAFHEDVGDPVKAFVSITTWLREGLLPGEVGFSKDYMKIVDAVNQRLPDLIAMPPRPPGDKIVIGEARVFNATTGRVITEEEIVNDV